MKSLILASMLAAPFAHAASDACAPTVIQDVTRLSCGSDSTVSAYAIAILTYVSPNIAECQGANRQEKKIAKVRGFVSGEPRWMVTYNQDQFSYQAPQGENPGSFTHGSTTIQGCQLSKF